jgi:hypothetical protein
MAIALEEGAIAPRDHPSKKRFIAIVRHLLQPIDQLTTEKTIQTLSDISHAEKN